MLCIKQHLKARHCFQLSSTFFVFKIHLYTGLSLMSKLFILDRTTPTSPPLIILVKCRSASGVSEHSLKKKCVMSWLFSRGLLFTNITLMPLVIFHVINDTHSPYNCQVINILDTTTVYGVGGVLSHEKSTGGKFSTSNCTLVCSFVDYIEVGETRV